MSNYLGHYITTGVILKVVNFLSTSRRRLERIVPLSVMTLFIRIHMSLKKKNDHTPGCSWRGKEVVLKSNTLQELK